MTFLSNLKEIFALRPFPQVRGEEEWAAREEARRIEVEGLKAELDAVKRAAESGGIDGKYVCLPRTFPRSIVRLSVHYETSVCYTLV